MSYRNGTYIAFDGQGELNHSKSDIKYFNLLKGWNSSERINFIDSHEKNGNVRDSSLDETKKASLRERLNNSKQILIIISEDTRQTGSLLDYEIEYAKKIGLPFIICYAGVTKRNIHGDYKHRLPSILRSYCDNSEIISIHVPFTESDIKLALDKYVVSNTTLMKGGYVSYSVS